MNKKVIKNGLPEVNKILESVTCSDGVWYQSHPLWRSLIPESSPLTEWDSRECHLPQSLLEEGRRLFSSLWIHLIVTSSDGVWYSSESSDLNPSSRREEDYSPPFGFTWLSSPLTESDTRVISYYGVRFTWVSPPLTESDTIVIPLSPPSEGGNRLFSSLGFTWVSPPLTESDTRVISYYGVRFTWVSPPLTESDTRVIPLRKGEFLDSSTSLY